MKSRCGDTEKCKRLKAFNNTSQHSSWWVNWDTLQIINPKLRTDFIVKSMNNACCIYKTQVKSVLQYSCLLSGSLIKSVQTVYGQRLKVILESWLCELGWKVNRVWLVVLVDFCQLKLHVYQGKCRCFWGVRGSQFYSFTYTVLKDLRTNDSTTAYKV